MIIDGNFNLTLVILSVVISTAASYTALDLAGRVRVSAGRSRQAWLLGAALAMGGGIWSMHFVAMLAFVMPMPVAYDATLTALSLVVAILVTGGAFTIVAPGHAEWRIIGLAGLFMGAGICSMHYIGMAAMRMNATISYDPVIVGLSFVIAVGASIVGLRIAFTTTSLPQRAAAALAMGVAISGMHYTGMAAATFSMNDTGTNPAGLSSLAQMGLALAVATTTFLILFLGIVGSSVDRRFAAVAAREAGALRASEERYRQLYEALQRETKQREHAEAALRQMQKMEAIGQLTGGIAHDFNNILTIVTGNLDRLIRDLRDDGELHRRAEAAHRGALRAADLTRRLLAFGRRQTLAPRRIDLNQLVLDTSVMLRRTISESIRIETVLAGEIWPCVLDPNQLESALLNLALNARDAMPRGGKLVMQTANADFSEGGAADVEGIEPGKYVQLAISDTGTGIPRENLQRVFEPFFTTKEIGKGIGLGLAQVYGFVKQSGGHATVYSEPTVGTTFRLYFPRAEAMEAEIEGTPPHEPLLLARAGERILVVEDETAVREYAAEALQELGYEVLQAEDAPAALKVLSGPPKVDLMFTDVGLPGLNGRVLADMALLRHPGLKLLFTTGYAGAAFAKDDARVPRAPVLQKPFNQKALAKQIRAALDNSAPMGAR